MRPAISRFFLNLGTESVSLATNFSLENVFCSSFTLVHERAVGNQALAILCLVAVRTFVIKLICGAFWF